ncbi:hypothetical protein LCGC14_1971500, partial [marine sediment metagenome]
SVQNNTAWKFTCKPRVRLVKKTIFKTGANGGPTARSALQLEAAVLRAFVDAVDVGTAVRGEFNERFDNIDRRIQQWSGVDPRLREDLDRLEQLVDDETRAKRASEDKVLELQRQLSALEDMNKLQNDNLFKSLERQTQAGEAAKTARTQRDTCQQELEAERTRNLTDKRRSKRLEELQAEQRQKEANETARLRAQDLEDYTEAETARTEARDRADQSASDTATKILEDPASASGDADAARETLDRAASSLQQQADDLRDTADQRRDPDDAVADSLRNEAEQYEDAVEDLEKEADGVDARAAAIPDDIQRKREFISFWRQLLKHPEGEKQLEDVEARLWSGPNFNFPAVFLVKPEKLFKPAAAVAKTRWIPFLDARTASLRGGDQEFPAPPHPTIAQVSEVVDAVVRNLTIRLLGPAVATNRATALDALMVINLALERTYFAGGGDVEAAGGWFTTDEWETVLRMQKQIQIRP